MALSGIQRFILEGAEVAPGHIDTLDRMSDNPAYEHIDISRQLILDPDLRDLRNQMFDMLGNEELLNSFADQTRENPELMDRVNYLIENDPQRLAQILPQFQENPDELAAVLEGAVTTEQLAAAPPPQENDPTMMFQQMMGQFEEIFSGLADGVSMESFGEVLLSVINGMYSLAGGIMSGLGSLMNSPERVVAGNGGPDGPYAQMRDVLGLDGIDYDEEGRPIVDAPAVAPEEIEAPRTDPSVDAVGPR